MNRRGRKPLNDGKVKRGVAIRVTPQALANLDKTSEVSGVGVGLIIGQLVDREFGSAPKTMEFITSDV